MTIICLVRHGQTDWNKNSLIQGRVNTSLNETGIKQARDAGELLLNNDPNWDIIYSSPLDRAYTTACIIKETLNLQSEIIVDDRLIEREFGEAEGMHISREIFNRVNNDDFQGFETREMLQKRTLNSLIDIANKNPNKKVLITTHSHYIKGLISYLNPGYDFYSTLLNGGLNYFYIDSGSIIDYKLNVTFID